MFIPQGLFLLQGLIHVIIDFPQPIEADTDEIEAYDDDSHENKIVPAHLPEPDEQPCTALLGNLTALLPASGLAILLGFHPITLSKNKRLKKSYLIVYRALIAR